MSICFAMDDCLLPPQPGCSNGTAANPAVFKAEVQEHEQLNTNSNTQHKHQVHGEV